jgi:hypothetical protein
MSIVRQTAIVVRQPTQVATARSNVSLPGSGLIRSEQWEILTIESIGQSAFTLASIPSQPHLSQVFLNGVKATFATDYTINLSVLTWLSVALDPDTDTLEIIYT